MTLSSKPQPYPLFVRILLVFISLFLVFISFHIMRSLTQPSRYINAYIAVKKGPARTIDLQKMTMFKFSQYLYLSGTIQDASNDKNTGPLFDLEKNPIISPSVFSDSTGAVEILTITEPYSKTDLKEFTYNQPVHMLGWRRGEAGFILFAIAPSQTELLELMNERTGNWKTTLLAQGLLLAVLLFTMFWLLNLIVLSNPSMQLFQMLIVNVIFLIVFYSVLMLAMYPLLETLVQTIEILVLVNVIFVPLSLFIGRKRTRN